MESEKENLEVGESDVLTVITIRRRHAADGSSSVTSQVGHGQYVNPQEVATAILMAERTVSQMKDRFFGVNVVPEPPTGRTVTKKKGPNLTDAHGNRISSKD